MKNLILLSVLVDMGNTQFMSVPYTLNAANENGVEAINEGNINK